MSELWRCRPVSHVILPTLALAAVATLLAWLMFPAWLGLGALFWYFIFGIYLPQEPALIYAGTLYSPWIVTLAAGSATLVAATLDYVVFNQVFKFRRVTAIKRSTVYRTAAKSFNKRPWGTTAIFAFLPLPFYPIRFLAISSGYSAKGYVSASVAGRLPRYYLLAMGGAWLSLSFPQLVLITSAFGALTLLVMMRGRNRSPDAQDRVLA